MPDIVCPLVPFINTARVLWVNVPPLLKFPPTYRSPLEPDEDKVSVPVVLATAPVTVRLPVALPMVIVPPELVRVPVIVVPPVLVL